MASPTSALCAIRILQTKLLTERCTPIGYDGLKRTNLALRAPDSFCRGAPVSHARQHSRHLPASLLLTEPEEEATSLRLWHSSLPAAPNAAVALRSLAAGLGFASNTGESAHEPSLHRNPWFPRWSSVLCIAIEKTMRRYGSLSWATGEARTVLITSARSA